MPKTPMPKERGQRQPVQPTLNLAANPTKRQPVEQPATRGDFKAEFSIILCITPDQVIKMAKHIRAVDHQVELQSAAVIVATELGRVGIRLNQPRLGLGLFHQYPFFEILVKVESLALASSKLLEAKLCLMILGFPDDLHSIFVGYFVKPDARSKVFDVQDPQEILLNNTWARMSKRVVAYPS